MGRQRRPLCPLHPRVPDESQIGRVEREGTVRAAAARGLHGGEERGNFKLRFTVQSIQQRYIIHVTKRRRYLE